MIEGGTAVEEPSVKVRSPRDLAFLSMLTLLACSDKTPQAAGSTPPSATVGSTTSGSLDPARGQRFVTPTGKVWTLSQTKHSSSQSVIVIQGEGFPHTHESLALSEGDPLEAAYLTDLDSDGWSELLIVRRSVGSGSYADLSGVASNSDLSFGPISIAKPEPRDPLFAGYRGHDTLRVEGPCFLRSFPVYRDQDPNAQASGGTRVLCYRLARGEAGFVLVPQPASGVAP
jgi:hypothetical protein